MAGLAQSFCRHIENTMIQKDTEPVPVPGFSTRTRCDAVQTPHTPPAIHRIRSGKAVSHQILHKQLAGMELDGFGRLVSQKCVALPPTVGSLSTPCRGGWER
jgi:hypothetical protein